MKPRKLTTELTLFYAVTFALLLTAVSALYYHLLAYQTDSRLNTELVERARALRGYLHFDGNEPQLVYDSTDPEEASFILNATRYYQVYDAGTGLMVKRSEEMEALNFQYTPDEVKEIAALAARHSALSGIQTDQVNLIIHSDLFHAPNGHTYLLQIGSSLHARDLTLSQLFDISLWLVPLCSLATAFLGWWMARRVLRPLKALGTVAQDISISQLHRRLPVRNTGDELDQLSQTFNQVLERLEKSVEQMKEFTANISHELRTPLTALRGEAAVALAKGGTVDEYRQVLESQLEEFEKFSRMVNQMLMLARAEAGQIKLENSDVDLSELACSLAEQMDPVAASKQITLSTQCERGVLVKGDTGWLERAMLNLLDNAIKFTPPDGTTSIGVRRSGHKAILEIHDNGIGIQPEVLPHIFERFYRGDPSRSKEMDGAGLGLSLVEWIVKAHHGEVLVESRVGHGSVFRISLPLAGAEASSKAATCNIN